MRFKDVKGFEGIYHISEYGDVYRVNPTPRWRKKKDSIHTKKNNAGYPTVELCADGQKKRFTVHRLVYQAFVGDIPEGMELMHLDGNPRNNYYKNLEAGTHSKNMQDAVNIHKTVNQRGENNNFGRLTADQVRQIRNLRKEGYELKIIAYMFGMSAQHVCRICNKKIWKSVE